MSQIIDFTEIDDLIMAAYNHVKKTGCKVRTHTTYDDPSSVFKKQLTLGLEASDGTIFSMTLISHHVSFKRSLSKQIRNQNVEVVDFINKQLIPFL